MDDFSFYLKGLSESIPPPKVQTNELLKSNILNLAQSLSIEFIKDNSLDQDSLKDVVNLLSSVIFTTCLTIGNPKENDENTVQVIYSSSCLLNYFLNLSYFISVIPNFVTNFVQITMAHIQGQASEDDFSNSSNSLVEYISTIIGIGNNVDTELQYVKSYNIPEIKQQIDILQQTLSKCISDANTIKMKHTAGQSSTEEEAALANSLQLLNTASSSLTQFFSQLVQQLPAHFDSSFEISALNNFQAYAQNLAQTTSCIVFISLKVALYNPTSFTQLIKVLLALSNDLFIEISSLFKTARFRGDFSKQITDARAAHDRIKQTFDPLLHLLIAAIPQCPSPFQNSVNAQLVPLFQSLQAQHSEFEKFLKIIIDSIKIDTKFILFLRPNTDYSTIASIFPALNIYLTLINEFNTNQDVSKLKQSVEKASSELELFNNFVHNLINENNSDGHNDVSQMIQKRGAIFEAVEQLKRDLILYESHSSNVHFRQKAYLSALNVIICMSSVGYHPNLPKVFDVVPQLLSKEVVIYFISNVQLLIDSMTFLMGRNKNLPREIFQGFVGLFSVFMGVFRESSGIFSGADPLNQAHVLTCIHETDNIYVLLNAIYSCFSDVELSDDLVATVQLVGIISENIRKAMDLLRAALQLKYIFAYNPILTHFLPFSQTIEVIGSINGYNNFTQLRENITPLIQKISEAFKTRYPISGIYDEQFIQLLYSNAQDIFGYAGQLLRYSTTVLGDQIVDPTKSLIESLNESIDQLGNISPFISKIHSNKKTPIPSFIGYLLKNDIKIGNTILIELFNSIKEKKEEAEQIVYKLNCILANASYDLDFIPQLSGLSENIKNYFRQLNHFVSELHFENCTSSALQIISDLFELFDELNKIVENYIQSSEAYGKTITDQLH